MRPYASLVRGHGTISCDLSVPVRIAGCFSIAISLLRAVQRPTIQNIWKIRPAGALEKHLKADGTTSVPFAIASLTVACFIDHDGIREALKVQCKDVTTDMAVECLCHFKRGLELLML